MLIVGQAELLRWLSQITGYTNITSYTNLVDGVAIMKYIQNTWPATCRKVIVGRFRWNPDNLGHYQDNWDMIQECFELLKIPGEIFDFPRLLGGHSKSFYHLLAVFYYIGAINAGTASTVAFKHPLESDVLAFLQSKGVVEIAQTERKRAILGRRGRRATVATPSNLTLIEDNEDEQGDLNFSSCDLARLFAEGSCAGSPTSGFCESGTKISMLEARPPPGRPVMKSRIFDDGGHEAQTPCKTQSSVPKQPSKFSITSHLNSLLSSPSTSEAECKHTESKMRSPTECPPQPSAGSESCTHPRQSTLSPTPSEHSRQETRDVLLQAPDNESSLQASLEASRISCVSVQHNLLTSELMRSSLSGATQPLLSADVSQLLKSKPVYPPHPSQNSSLGIHLTLESRQSRMIPSRTLSATDDTSGNLDQPAEQSGLLLTPPGAAAVVQTKNPCSSMLTRTTDSPSSDDSLKLSTTLPLTLDNEKKTPRECPPRWPQKKEQLRYSPIECTSSSPDGALLRAGEKAHASPEKDRDRIQVRVEPPVFGSDQNSATDENTMQYSASGTGVSSTGNVFRSPLPQPVNASVSDLLTYGDPIGMGAGMGGSNALTRQLSTSGDTGALSEYLYNPSVLHLKEVEPYPSTTSFGDVDSVALQMRARSNAHMRMSASKSAPSEQHLVDSDSRVLGDLAELEKACPVANSKPCDVLGSKSGGPTSLGLTNGYLNTSCGILLNDASPLTISQVSTPTLPLERAHQPAAPLSALDHPPHKVTPPGLDSLPHHDVHSGMVTPRANWMDTLLHQDSIDPLFNISLPSRRVLLASSPEVSAKSHCDPASDSVDKAIEIAVHQRFESLKTQLVASAQQLQSYGSLVHALERAADLSREELGQIRDMYESRLEALQELSHSKAEILARSLHLAFLRSAEEVGAHSAIQSLLAEHEAQLTCHEERLRTYEAVFTHDLASLARFDRAYDQLLHSNTSAILKAANESLALELKEARKEIASLTALIETSQNDSKLVQRPEMDTPENLVIRSLRNSPEKPVQIPPGALAVDGYLKALLLSTKLLGRLETAEKEIEGLRGWASVFDRVNAELVELALRQQEKEGDCKTIEAALAAYADNIQKVRATLRKPVGDDVTVGALVGLMGELPTAITEILTKHRDALCLTAETDSPVAPHILNCILDVRKMAGALETAGVEDTPQARIDLLRAIALQLLSTNAILRDRVSILEAHVQAVDEFLKDNRAGLITSLVQSEECQSRLAESLHADVADVRAQCEQEVRDMKQAAVHLLTENEGLRAELAQCRTLLEEGNSEHLASLDAGALQKTCISLLRGLCMLYRAALTESGADQSSPVLRPYLEEAERLERELETRKRQAQAADGKTIFASLTSAQRALRDELTTARGELAGERDIVARQAAELEELRRQAAALEQENRALRVQQAAAGFATQLELLVAPV
ncbi:hypothetical protein GMRT_12572 [Giardia muris]|uniref:Calponin-homology (CH) domain-containing protein n=1 Tax=Giardia muris TaxID=5742 RepID=A0A4Z1SRR8_GIAMU|nr:hypothetical protein GMRT_12572 [Giardia muris]|eukprot:TNJ28440.1 hypothetical protein GMRT_12572 [Giardia muris]